MANKTNPGGVDLLAGFQAGKGGGRVGGEVEGGGRVRGTSGLADAALVIAQDGQSLAGQVIRKNEKGLMVIEGLVAIVRA